MKKILVLLCVASLFVLAPGCGSGIPEQSDENTIRTTVGEAGEGASVRDKSAEMKMKRGPKGMDSKKKKAEQGK